MTARHSTLFTLESGDSVLGFYTTQRDAALGFGDCDQSSCKKRTKRERFLAEMEAVVAQTRFKVVARIGSCRRIVIDSSAVVPCISTCKPARIESNPAPPVY